MTTADERPGHETEEMTSTSTGSPQSSQEQTTGEAPPTGEGTDVSYRTEAGPEEELSLGEGVARSGDDVGGADQVEDEVPGPGQPPLDPPD